MSKANETIQTWDKIAQLYEERFMHLDIYNESYDFLYAQTASPDASVLELGCGPGMIAKYLLSKQPQLQFLGTDVAPNMIALAQNNVPNARFQLLDAREILSLNKQFDLIVSGFCIPYLSAEEVEKFIADCRKMLSEKGLLYISFVPGDESKSEWQTGSSGDRVYFNFHAEQRIIELFRRNKFQLLKRFVIPYKKVDGQIEEHLVLIASKQ